MARTMGLNSKNLYRTVVVTTMLKDWHSHSSWRSYRAGDVVTEVFGPHSDSSRSRNYSEIPLRIVVGSRPAERSDYYPMDDATWERYYAKRTENIYEENATRVVKHQVQKSVFKKVGDESFEIEIEWVDA